MKRICMDLPYNGHRANASPCLTIVYQIKPSAKYGLLLSKLLFRVVPQMFLKTLQTTNMFLGYLPELGGHSILLKAPLT